MITKPQREALVGQLALALYDIHQGDNLEGYTKEQMVWGYATSFNTASDELLLGLAVNKYGWCVVRPFPLSMELHHPELGLTIDFAGDFI